MFSIKNVWLLILSINICNGIAQDSTCKKNCGCNSRPDFHAPIGVMLDHAHDRGQWMVSYRYMNMFMNGNIKNASSIESDAIMQNYIMSPNNMQMQMHMLMLMYGITSKITVMAMANYVVNDMSMTMSMYGMKNMNMGSMNMTSMNSTMTMTDNSKGFSDTKLYVLYKLIQKNNHEILVSNGINLPTGSISLYGTTPTGQDQRKSYSMQLGTGTYAWLPGLTYTGNVNHMSWGAQATGIINIGVNRHNYCYGNTANATAWIAYKWNNWLSNSIRIEGNASAKMYGFDKEISPYRTTDPMADTKNSGGKRLGVFAGMNFLIPKGCLKGNQLLIEYGIPFYQQVNGIQMKTTQMIFAGWQMSF